MSFITQVDRDGNSTYQAKDQSPRAQYHEAGDDAINIDSDSCIQLRGASG